MAEYIEREALVHHFMTKRHYLTKDLVMDAAYEVSKFPAADVAAVVHGRWIKTDNGVRKNINTGRAVRVYLYDCSVCGWHTGNQGENFNYCPNCGARMDGGNAK